MKATAEQIIAVCGCGSMGAALVKALCSSGVAEAKQIVCCDIDQRKTAKLAGELGVRTAATVEAAVDGAAIIIIAVKPGQVAALSRAIVESPAALSNRPLVISVAAGLALSKLKSLLGTEARLVRAMPNVACLVGAGITGLFAENRDDAALARELFIASGEAEIVAKESDLDAVTGLSGSGPGYMFLLMEALADGGVKMGLPREQALKFAVHTVLGSGMLARETGIHPAQLKDMVASPAGTTIEGLQVLEQRGVRGAVIAAVEAATLKARGGS